jgi:hypothetical protein
MLEEAKKLFVTVLGVAIGIGIAQGIGAGADRIFLPKPEPASIRMEADGSMIRYSYIPQYSLIRSAREWYDRVIEVYQKDQYGEYVLKTRKVCEYKYPIFFGPEHEYTEEKF